MERGYNFNKFNQAEIQNTEHMHDKHRYYSKNYVWQIQQYPNIT